MTDLEGLLTDEDMEIDWTDNEGNPVEKVTITKGEIYALLKAQCDLTTRLLKGV